MLLMLLAIPRHLSWTAYALVHSHCRLLPAIQFFIPKAITVQRWCSPEPLSDQLLVWGSFFFFSFQVQRFCCPSLPLVVEVICRLVLFFVDKGGK